MRTTLDETRDAEDQGSFCLFIAFHRDHGRLGLAHRLLPGARLELGRDLEVMGLGTFEDPRISRRHCRLEIDATGALIATDLGSRNGTHLDGARFERAVLSPGSLLRLGSVLLLVARCRSVGAPRNDLLLAGPSASVAELAEALDSALAVRAPLLLVGEAGSAAANVARAFAERAGGCTELSLDGWTDRLPDAWLAAAAAPGGALLSRGLPIAGCAAERALSEVLARTQQQPDVGPWHLVVTTAPPHASKSFAARAEEIGLRHLVVPPLRARPEDVTPLAAAWCRAHDVDWPLLGVHEWATLLGASWSRNLEQLWALLAQARVARERGEPPDTAAWMRQAASPAGAHDRARDRASPDSESAIDVASDGSWLVLPSIGRIGLHRKPVLARLLAMLVRARIERPGAVLRPAALLASVWPGERFVDGSGENRLRVALTGLRQLGLRAIVERVDDGYRLSPSVAFRPVDEPSAGAPDD